MSNFRRGFILSVIFILVLVFLGYSSNVFATSNMDVNQTNETTTRNNVRDSSTNSARNNDNTVTNTQTALDTNTTTSVQSVDEFNDTSSGLGLAEILNILLLTVGLVLILLAVAIWIRLRK